MSYCPEILHKTSLGGSVCGISHIEEAKRRDINKKAEERVGENLGL